MTLVDLPDIPLLNIFNRLPLWKILQLSKLCHRLNNIKQEVFQKRTKLRLLGGCRTSTYNVSHLKKLINSLDLGQDEVKFDFDLILDFDHEPNNYWKHAENRVIKLSHDIHVRSLEQIADLKQMFPKLERLTIAFTDFCGPASLVQLLRNWPKLTHLYFVDFQRDSREPIDYENAIMAINNLHDLQVLAIYSPFKFSPRIWPLKILEPLLQNSTKMHTLYFSVSLCTKLVGQHIEFANLLDRRLNASLEIPFDRFERFGLVDHSPQSGNNRANEHFTSKTTRLEVRILHHLGTEIRQLVNWSALQYLNLIVDLKDLSLSRLLDPLTDLHNLHEFHLINESSGTFNMPLESRARQLPQLVGKLIC